MNEYTNSEMDVNFFWNLSNNGQINAENPFLLHQTLQLVEEIIFIHSHRLLRNSATTKLLRLHPQLRPYQPHSFLMFGSLWSRG